MATPILDVRNLSVSYASRRVPVQAVRAVTFEVSPGETFALVGETGCGKSTIALSLLGLLHSRDHIEGEILFEGRELRRLTAGDWRRIRGRKIGSVFQDSRGSLNPVLTIEDHLIEALRAHRAISRSSARIRARELLAEVGIAKLHTGRYPSQLSRGMCQRVGLALAICNSPGLLIADEPTSALDPTIQAQLLKLLRRLKQTYGLALLLVSHDLALVAEFADRVGVMYHGHLVEVGKAREVFAQPRHPYTRALIDSLPDLQHRCFERPLYTVPGASPVSGEEFSGCPFAPRCPLVESLCHKSRPSPEVISEFHWAACIKAR